MLTVITPINHFRLSRTPAFITINTSEAAQPHIRIDVDVIRVSWDGIEQTLVGQDSLTPDDDGNATFELSEYFNTPLLPGFTWPETGNMFRLHEDASAKYILNFYEVYASEPDPPDVQSSLTLDHPGYFVATGKVPKHAQILFYSIYTNFDVKLLADDLTLTFQNIAAINAGRLFAVRTIKNTPRKLYIMAPSDLSSLQLKAVIEFEDGSQPPTATFQAHQNFELLKGQVAEILCGYDFLNLDGWIAINYPAYVGKTVSAYTLQVFNSTSSISPLFRFEIDNGYNPYRRVFLFLNSMGGYDTFETFGLASSETQYEYDIVDTPFWPGAATALRRNIRTVANETITCNTGFISRDTLLMLPEFFASEEVYELLDDELIPIIFHDQAILRRRDQPGLLSAEFSYEHLTMLIHE